MQKSYSELLLSSKKRHSDLETLMDFVQSATNELMWLSEKEEREITRDWSSKNLSLPEVEQYYEVNLVMKGDNFYLYKNIKLKLQLW